MLKQAFPFVLRSIIKTAVICGFYDLSIAVEIRIKGIYEYDIRNFDILKPYARIVLYSKRQEVIACFTHKCKSEVWLFTKQNNGVK